MTRKLLEIEFGIGLVADGWFEIGGRQEGHLRLSLELDGLRLVDDRMVIWK